MEVGPSTENGNVSNPLDWIKSPVEKELWEIVLMLMMQVEPRQAREIVGELIKGPWGVAKKAFAQELLKKAWIDDETGLPDVTTKDNFQFVVPTFEELKARLNRITAVRGKKAELARYLGVRKPQVSVWLSEKGDRVPSGDKTLLMLAWVQAEEAQMKSPADDATPAGPKTRKKQNHHELPKSSPQPD